MPHDDHAHADLQPLLDRLAAGDESALDQLIERSNERLEKLAHFIFKDFPLVRRWYETGDVAQAARLRLTRALKDGVKPASPRDFMNFAAKLIRRELIDLARREYGPEGAGAHHATGPLEGGGDGTGEPRGQQHAAPGAGPATEVGWKDLLQHGQDRLPAEEWEVFDLLFIQKLSQAEVADILGISIPSVKRRWRSARLLLHQAGFAAGEPE